MNFKDIARPNVENLKTQFIEAITKKAQELSMEPSTILNRRELVAYLQETLGTELKDGPYLRYFLKIAYEKNSFSNTLKKIITFNFRENEGTNSIYNPERVEDNIFSLDLANPSLDFNHFKLIQKQSEDLKQVDGVGEIRAIKEDIENLKRESTLSITGESKVEAYRDYALRLKEKYENMILTYEQIKNLNLSLISDYETLKNKLRLIRED